MRLKKEDFIHFFDRKGFYIVLFLCVVAVGATAVYVTNNNLKKLAEIKKVQQEEFGMDNQDNLWDYVTNYPEEKPAKSKVEEDKKEGLESKIKDNKENKQISTSKSISETKPVVKIENNNKTLNLPKESDTKKVSSHSIVILRPVEGNIILGFAKDKLVYSKTLDEWTTHNGIDIAAPLGTTVLAAMDGIVEKIYNDEKLGNTVVIKSGNIETRYSNLDNEIFVKQKDKVNKGQEIGRIGKSARFEIAEEPHLHFEVLENGNYLDPELFIK